MEKKLVPELRFPEFSGEWEEKNLGDIATIKTGNTNVQDAVDDGKYVFFDRSVIVKKIDKYDYDEETIIYPGEGSEFYPRYYQGKYALHQRAYSITSEVVNLKYLYNIMMSKNNHFLKMAVGSTVKSLRMDNFTECRISMPSRQEQEKIATFFSLIDRKIEKQEEKIASIEDYKRGMMQKLFPKKGENIPELRFKGFTDPWEQRKLGEVAENFEYGLNAAATEYDGINKYIRITDIDDESRIFKQDDLTSPDTNLDLAERYKLQEGDILFARTGASVGKSYIYTPSDGLVYYAGFLIRGKVKSEYDIEFVFQNTLTESYKKYISITSQRSGQPGVNAQEYQEYTFYVPKYNEQVKIGNFFSNLDNLITLHQRKLEELKELKKGFMQKMFI